MEKVQDPGTPGFYSWLLLVPKKNGKLRPVIDFSILKETTFQDGDSQISKVINNGQ